MKKLKLTAYIEIEVQDGFTPDVFQVTRPIEVHLEDATLPLSNAKGTGTLTVTSVACVVDDDQQD